MSVDTRDYRVVLLTVPANFVGRGEYGNEVRVQFLDRGGDQPAQAGQVPFPFQVHPPVGCLIAGWNEYLKEVVSYWPDENPAAARLGEELRQLRIAAGYPTIQALAARIDGYGDSMLAKVEQGRRTASRQLFPAWLNACAVHIETKSPVLTDSLRRAQTALWELALKREGPIPEFIELWLKREAAAAFLRLWALNVLPGLLQTYEYAHANGLIGPSGARKVAG